MELIECFRKAVSDGASDLFIVAGAPVNEKIRGCLQPIGGDKLLPADTKEILTQIYQYAGRDYAIFANEGDDDFSFAIPGLARFRVNAYRQRGSVAAVVRVVRFEIPDYKEYGIPEQIIGLSELMHGMVVFTGTAGSGKSTTQACIIDRINKTRECHIITLEDPIEFLHRNNRSIVSQREIAIDTKDGLSGLRACLRQAPDVILLGEMRDFETIRTAMTAAETGHLVITTLHTMGAVNAVDRIIDTFPSNQQEQVRIQLGSILRTVVSQQLIPNIDGKLVPAFEIMKNTSAVRSLIRDSRTHQLRNVIAAGAADGMISMDQSIFSLYEQGQITAKTAIYYADNPEQMRRRIPEDV